MGLLRGLLLLRLLSRRRVKRTDIETVLEVHHWHQRLRRRGKPRFVDARHQKRVINRTVFGRNDPSSSPQTAAAADYDVSTVLVFISPDVIVVFVPVGTFNRDGCGNHHRGGRKRNGGRNDGRRFAKVWRRRGDGV